MTTNIMIEQLITAPNIMFFIGIFGLVFTIYNRFTEPQIKSDKADALFKQDLLAIGAKFEERFLGFDKSLSNLRDNHLHTITEDVKTVTKSVNELAILVAKLETKIDERIPRK